MAQVGAGHPFLLSVGVHFSSSGNQQVTSLLNSDHYNKNNATRGPASQVPHTLPELPLRRNKRSLPILGSLLNTAYSQICLSPCPFLKVTPG